MPLTFDMELARRFVRSAAGDRDVVLIGLTGAHAYGFPSENSDFDLKGVMLLPASSLLGLDAPAETLDRMAIFEGVEVDHPDHSAETRAKLRPLAERLGLLQLGSSDHHGHGKVNHELACETTAVEVYDEIVRRIKSRGGQLH